MSLANASTFARCSAAVLVFVGTIVAAPALAGDLGVEGAWIRLPPPGANTAGYMTLVNRSDAKITVTGVSAEGVERLEMHKTVVEGDVARMRPIDAIEIPPGGRAVLAPRGLHLMLIRPGTLTESQTVELVLTLAGGGEQRIEVPVRRAAPAS